MRRLLVLALVALSVLFAAIPLAQADGLLLGSGRVSYLGVVATRGMIEHTQNQALFNVMSRTAHVARSPITAVRLVTGNWFVNEDIINGSGGGTYQEIGTGVAQTRTASVEYPAGTCHQVKWSGSSSVSEASGSTYESDDDTVTIPNGATFWVNMYVVNTAGIIITRPVGNPETLIALGDKTILSGGVDSTVSCSFNDAGAFGAAGGYGDFPIAIVGQTRNASVFVLGTSRTEGIKDGINVLGSGDLGIIARSVGPTVGYINAGTSGIAVSQMVGNMAKRSAIANKYTTTTVMEGPTNDILTSLPTVEANLQTVWGYFTGKVIAITCDPETSSTDNWATTVNQTITKNFETTGVNPYLRTVPSPLASTADITTATSSDQKWNPNGTPDGLHENQFSDLNIEYSNIITPGSVQ